VKREFASKASTDARGKEGGGPRSGFESEREEETRDRAERGSVVRGSDQASVAAKQDPLPTDQRNDLEREKLAAAVSL
jgi:hypothetical protein